MADIRRVLSDAGATQIRVSKDEAQRLLFWSGRKAAFPGGRAASRRTTTAWTARFRAGRSPRAARIEELSRQFGLRCANVFHAGDGNLHPLILFDANVDGEIASAPRHSARRSCELCIEVGGTITGEHGVGVEKLAADVRAVRAGGARALPRHQGGVRPDMDCSIPARPCRRCTAARSSARCTCTTASCRIPTCRASDGDDR